MSKKRIIYIFLIAISIFSCDRRKPSTEIKPEKVRKLVQILRDNEIDYNTVFIKKLAIDFNNNGNKIGAKGYIKSIKDSMTTISIVPFLGIEMARIYLRRDSIYVLNRLEKTAYVNSYKYFNDKYNLDIKLNDIQRLLLNSFTLFDELNTEKYNGKTKIENNKHIIEINIGYNIKLQVSENQKLKAAIVQDEKNNINFRINYLEYKEFGKKVVPNKMTASLDNNGDRYLLKVNYSNIEFNKKVIDNFEISSKYKKVLLK